MRSLIIGLGVVVVLLVVAAGGFLVWLANNPPVPDITTAGGTVLVYEVDEAAKQAPDYQPDQLAEALKRRLDPAGVAGIKVRPLEASRVEIAVPRARGDHARDVLAVKEMLSQVGELEFRIVANAHVDMAALQGVAGFYHDARDEPGTRKLLESAARRGEVPPINPDPAKSAEKFQFDSTKGDLSYSWVRLGPLMLAAYGLDEAGEQAGNPNWLKAKEARDQGEAARLQDNLILSRKAMSPADPEAEGKVEYFILTRDPKPGKEITGRYLAGVSPGVDSRMQHAVNFRWDATGADLFRELTSANQPVIGGNGHPGFETQIAIILDGVVMSAPSIRTTIGADGQITGNFTEAEVDRLVKILRSGALPARLKPVPVSEMTVEPGAGGKPRQN